jgi:phosphoribosyl 1,2-cyclic phosphodiesterase
MSERLGQLINIGTSSKGNAFFVEIKRDGFDKPFGLLLDCGFAYDKIAKSLREYGKSVNDIDAILVTHEHLDHCVGVKEMVDRGKRVFAPPSVFNRIGVTVNETYHVKGLTRKGIADGIIVLPIPLTHLELDGTNILNYGYVIDVNNDFRIMYITDTKYVEYNLRPFPSDVIIVEANFEIRRMNVYIDNAVGFEKEHYKRVLNSHMSVQHTAKWLSNMDLSKTRLIILMHLTSNSKNVNTFDFREIVEKKLKSVGKKHIPQIKVGKMNGGFQ